MAELLNFASVSELDRAEPRVIQSRDGDIHLLADEAQQALVAADAPFYIRVGLVRPIVDEVAASHGRTTRIARLKQVDVPTLVDHMSRSAKWVKWNARKKELVPTNPPPQVASIILSRDGEWNGFRPLVGVITTPTLRPDGTILSQPGYDKQTQLLLRDPPTLPAIPDKPSRADALAAIRLLDALLEEFPFIDEASRSVALSGLITPVVRGCMTVAPMHATTAPVPGSGKSYIIDLCSALATGECAPVLSAGRTEEETEKRLGAALLAGQPIITLDNVNGELGGDALCQYIERPLVQIRVLGVSQNVKVRSSATCYATGNNIRLVGDMTRRVILCSLDPNMERPETRVFQTKPLQLILSDRPRYIAAALTVVRAYVVAGFPNELPPLASFDDWSRMVRSALVWLGYADPVETIAKARAEDPVTESLSRLLSSWYDAFGSTGYTSGMAKERAGTRNANNQLTFEGLHEVMSEIASDPRGGISAQRLGRFLGNYSGRIVDGLKFVSETDSHAKQKLWKVVNAR